MAEVSQYGTFAVAVFSRSQDAGACRCLVGGCGRIFLLGHQHGDDTLAFFEHHAAHPTAAATDGADIVFIETHRFATVAEEHHIVVAIGERCADEVVALVQVDPDGLTPITWADKDASIGQWAITPGIDFGEYRAHEHVRFAYTRPIERLREGVRRIQGFLQRSQRA